MYSPIVPFMIICWVHDWKNLDYKFRSPLRRVTQCHLHVWEEVSRSCLTRKCANMLICYHRFVYGSIAENYFKLVLPAHGAGSGKIYRWPPLIKVGRHLSIVKFRLNTDHVGYFHLNMLTKVVDRDRAMKWTGPIKGQADLLFYSPQLSFGIGPRADPLKQSKFL